MDRGEFKMDHFWVEDFQLDKLKRIKEGGFVLAPLRVSVLDSMTKKMSKFVNLFGFMKAKEEITNTYKERLAEVLARYPEIDADEAKSISEFIFSVEDDPFESAEFKADITDYETRFEHGEVKLYKYHFKYEETGVATCLDFDLVVNSAPDKSLSACKLAATQALKACNPLPEPKREELITYEKGTIYFVAIIKIG